MNHNSLAHVNHGTAHVNHGSFIAQKSTTQTLSIYSKAHMPQKEYPKGMPKRNGNFC